MNKNSQLLLKFSGLFAVIGAFLGSHMAGAGSYAFRPIHAHILVVGWLSLFAFAVYYKIFQTSTSLLTTIHVWTAIIGSLGLTVGMWFYLLNPFQLPDPFVLIFYIVGGSTLLISFICFFLLTMMYKEKEEER